MEFDVIDLGFCEYKEALEKQEFYHRNVYNGNVRSTLIFVEHDHVYTLGKNADNSNILDSTKNNIHIHNIDRGGDVTYHGPGQLVGYPIFNIKQMNMSIGRYVHTLENIIIAVLNNFSIDAQVREKLIGVWVRNYKIASIGVRVIKGVTKHGFAINVNTDISYFDGIVPCGIENCKITSMEQLLGKKVGLEEIQKQIISQFKKNFI